MPEQETKAPQQQLEIQRIYVKDLSLEVPNAPKVFQEEWKPEINIDLNVKNASLETNIFEVVLLITVTAKQEGNVLFLAEVHQAGVFLLSGFEKAQEDHLLGAFCPSILFPYAREAVSGLVNHASFPQLNLTPINFEALYTQQQATDQSKEKGDIEDTKH